MRRAIRCVVLVASALSGFAVCAEPGGWQVSSDPIGVVTELEVPESACFDPETGLVFISNIVGQGWESDGVGYITMTKPGEDLEVLKWRQATPQGPLSAPKGMCVLKGWLYVADNDRVHRFAIRKSDAETLTVPNAERLNDMATDGRAVFVSDIKRGSFYRLDPETGAATEIKAVASLNGITFHKGRMYGVSWDLHEVYELDPTGRRKPRPFGLAEHFTTLDGIEVLDDGCFVVSDFQGNRVCLISPDAKSVSTLVKVTSPADIGLDRKGGRLFVPEFSRNQVDIYSLTKEE